MEKMPEHLKRFSEKYPAASGVFAKLADTAGMERLSKSSRSGICAPWDIVINRGECWTFAKTLVTELRKLGVPADAEIITFSVTDDEAIESRENEGYHDPERGTLHAYAVLDGVRFDCAGKVSPAILKSQTDYEEFDTAAVRFWANGPVSAREDVAFAEKDTVFSRAFALAVSEYLRWPVKN